MVKEADDLDEVVTVTEETVEDSPKKRGIISKKRITRKIVTKKRSKKKTTKKRKRKIATHNRKETERMEKMLIENFISMQKVMTNMAEKFDGLSKQLSKLLHLFENSAKALVEKEINLEFKGIDKQEELVDKLNIVLEQNKIIAKGLTLMHETAITPGNYYSLNERRSENIQSKPINPVSFETSSNPVQQQMPQKTPIQKENQLPNMELGLMESHTKPPSPNFGVPVKKPKSLEEKSFQSSELSSN